MNYAAWGLRKLAGRAGLVPVEVPIQHSSGKVGKGIRWKSRGDIDRAAGEREIKDPARRQEARHEVLRSVAEHALTNPTGFSFRPVGDKPAATSGYMVGAFHPNDLDALKVVADATKLNREQLVTSIVEKAERDLDKVLASPDHYFGGWLDSDTNTIYFEVSRNVQDLDEAKRLGAPTGNNQKAIWDVGAGAEIKTGGTGEKDSTREKRRGSLIPKDGG